MALNDHSLLRRPQHHRDLEKAHHHVHWTELFYDLIHVVTIFLLGNYLSHHLDLHGFLVFAAVFIVLWYAWAEVSNFNSIFVSTDVWHRVIMSMMICTVMFMAAAIPSSEGKGWPYFAIGFAANRALIAALYFRARRRAFPPYRAENRDVFGARKSVPRVPGPGCFRETRSSRAGISRHSPSGCRTAALPPEQLLVAAGRRASCR